MRNILLIAGIAIPVIYFANLFGVGAVAPGFDHASALPSELGSEDMGRAMRGAAQCTHCFTANYIFNAGLIAVGACGALAAIGLFLALRVISNGVVLAGLTALCMLAFGISMMSYGVFPMPDPRHHSLDMLLILSMLTPLFGALALKDSGADRWIVLAGFAGILAMIALNAGFGGIANETNIGWIVRAHGAIAFATFAYLCWAALRHAAIARAP